MIQHPRIIKADFGTIEVGWDGNKLAGELIALDTETESIVSGAVPRLALLAASDGQRHVIIPPADVEPFLRAHVQSVWVGHNFAAFDFWVLVHHLSDSPDLVKTMWDKAAAGEIRDSLLLARLVALGRRGDPFSTRDWPGTTLESLANTLTDIRLDKAADAKYRMRYAELIGKDLAGVADEGWFIYPARDAVAALHVYAVLLGQATELVKEHRINQAVVDEFGPLTEFVQVQGAIALADAERRGLHVDQARLADVRKWHTMRMRQIVASIEDLLKSDPDLQGMASPFRYENGKLETTNDGVPRHLQKPLQLILFRMLDLRQKQTGEHPYIPRQDKSQGLSTRHDDWVGLCDFHPFLKLWFELGKSGKLIASLPEDVDAVHPHYNVIVVTGRTSCARPNIQNPPREGGIREIYTGSPNHVLIGADYSALELRTLAQECLERFGSSRLCEVFRKGGDPHAMTAAMMLGISDQEFAELGDEVREVARQKAKAANFGFPGGLGKKAFVAYAKASYGLEMTEVEADRLKTTFLATYPEVVGYLRSDDDMATIARNLHCNEEVLWEDRSVFNRPAWLAAAYMRVLRGEKGRADGQAYTESWTDRVWSVVAAANRNEELSGLLARRIASQNLVNTLLRRPALTRTGRVRANCRYTEARNTPFQGLAADGAKLALFELVRRGMRVVAFLHDEIIIEALEGSDYEAVGQELREVMVAAMAKVVPSVPIKVGDAIPMRRWSKDAELVRDRDGRVVPWDVPASDAAPPP